MPIAPFRLFLFASVFLVLLCVLPPPLDACKKLLQWSLAAACVFLCVAIDAYIVMDISANLHLFLLF